MRKHRVIITIAIAAVITVCGVFIFDCVYYYSQALADDFDLDDYAGMTDEFKEYIAYDPLPTQIGPVADKKAAKQKAEAYWLEHSGEDVKEQKPYYAFFDEDAEAWHITTKKSFSHIWEGRRMGGGAAHLIVRSDGEVLAVWRDK